MKTKQTNFRAWKSGKSWLYSASVLTVLAGGGAVVSTLAVPSIVAQADVTSDAVSAASSANSDASAANETASQISGESNVASQSSLVSQLSSQASDFLSSASSSIPTISSAVASGSATTSGTVDSYSSAVDSYSSAMSSYLSSASDTVAENTKNSGILVASQAASDAYTSYSNAVASMNSAEETLSSAVSNAQSLVSKMNDGGLTAAEVTSLSEISQSYAQYVTDLESSMAAVSAPENSYFDAVSSLQALDSNASIAGGDLVVDSETGNSLSSASYAASAYLDSLDVMSTGSLIALAADYAAASSAQSSTASLAASFGSMANSTALSMNDQQNGALSMASSYYTAKNYGSAAELMNSYYSMAKAAPSVFDSLATSFASLQNSLSAAIESYNTLGSTFNIAASQAASAGFIDSYTAMTLIASTTAGLMSEAMATGYDLNNPNYQILSIDDRLAQWTGFYMDGTSEADGLGNSLFQEFFTENNTKNTDQWSTRLTGTPGQWDSSSINPLLKPDYTQAQMVPADEKVTLSTWGGQVTVTAEFPTGEYVKVNPVVSSVSIVSLDTPPTAPTIAVTPVAAVANEPSIDIEKSSKPIGEPGDGNHGDADNNIGTGDADTTSTSEDLSAGKTIYFRVTNNGSQALANIKVSDSQLMGSKMVTGITWTFNGAALTIGEDGFFYLDGVLLVLQPGEAVYGQGQIDAAPAGETEGDEAAVTANPVNPDGSIDTSKTVGDEDKWYGKTNSESPANESAASGSPSAPNTPAQTPVSYSPAVKPAPESPVSGDSEKQLPETGESTNKTMLLAGFITLGTAMVLAYGGSERKKHLMKLVLNAKHHQL